MAVAAGFPPEVLDEMRRHELESRRQRSSAQPLGHQLDQAKDRVKRLRGVEERAVARLQKAQEERYDAEDALAIAEAEVEELRERIAKLSDEEEDEEEAEAGAEGDGEYELEDAAGRTEGLAASAGGLVGVLEEECLREGPVPARVSEALAAVKRSLSASRERSEAKSPAGTSAPRTPRPRSYAAAVSPAPRESAAAASSSGAGGTGRARHEADGYFSGEAGEGDEEMSSWEAREEGGNVFRRSKREAAEALAVARATRRR